MNEFNQQSDRDLLITLHEQVKGIRLDIADLKDTTKNQVNDHEVRLRALERRLWIISGGLTLLAFITPYIWNLFHK